MATFTVTTTADSGAGSLRQAVLDANAAAGEDSIVFDAAFDGGAEDLIRLTGGQIVVTGRLNIYGGASQVTITGDAAGDDVTDAAGITDVAASGAGRLDDNSRIFDASAALKLDGLILTGGRTTGEGESGGAVRTAANLTLIDCTVSGNSATIYVGALGSQYLSNSRIKLFDCKVSGNGGVGIYGDDVTVTNSTVSGNGGNGISVRGYTWCWVSVTDSSVYGNGGDGISASGIGSGVFVTSSSVSGNVGRGIDASGSYFAFADVAGSTVSNNTGGGISAFSEYGTVRVTDSTVSGNSVTGDHAAGGGVWAGSWEGSSEGGSVLVANSTVSGNSAVGTNARGGGIHAYGDVRAINSTISGNRAEGEAAEGGGIWSQTTTVDDPSSKIRLTNSILLGNAASSAASNEYTGPLVLKGGNIVGGSVFHGGTEIGRTSAAQVFKATDTIDGGVLAGRLADNGGPTETIALRFDVTNPALGGGFAPYAPAFDQRGVVRDAAPDLGAFESGPVDGLVLAGTAKADTLTGSALRDQIYGRNGNDLLRGLAGGDQLRGEAGADRLGGGAGRDGLDGGTGRDWLKGGPGSDWLHGGDGADTLDGGGGDDLLSGGRGADLFVFAGSFGQDRIARFDADPAGGQDLIDLRAFAIPPGLFDDRVVVTDLGDDTRITVIGHGEILCPGVSGDGANAIDATDFLL